MTDEMTIYFLCSCDPNLVRVTGPGGCLVVAAGREVEPGAELADMYTQHWTEQATGDRRDYLQVTSNMKVSSRCRVHNIHNLNLPQRNIWFA